MRWKALLELDEKSPLKAEFLETPRRVHFLGIGGIGMSALAKILIARGHFVSGSDAGQNAQTEELAALGAQIFVGHDAKNLGEAEAVFLSSAIGDDNPELVLAREKGIPCWHRSQLMAAISNAARVSIAVSGTHGKSTTSALISHILERTNANPTAILGAVYPPFNSNVRVGDPDLVVVEADESDGSFSLLKPTVSVILNVEPEHMENYDDDERQLWAAFEGFADGARHAVLNGDAGLRKSPFKDNPFAFFYGFKSGDLLAKNIVSKPGQTDFEVFFGSAKCGNASLRVPGRHNVSNALAGLAACALAMENKTPFQIGIFARHLQTFAGTLRRFERKGEADGVVVYDDYGHHPTEVRATLEAARDFLARPLTVVFQPHRYSRTQQLGAQFGPTFEAADCVVICELYSAFETPIAGVSGKIVFDAVKKSFPNKRVLWAPTLEDAKTLAIQNTFSGAAILTMGAGNVTTLGAAILEELALRGRGSD